MKAIPLGQLLIEEGILTEDQLSQALALQKTAKKRIGVLITELGFATEKEISKALARRLNVEYLENPIFSIEAEVVRRVPEALARKYRIVPLNIREGTLTIVTNDPLDFSCLEDVGMITGMEVSTVLSTGTEIDKAIDRVYAKRNADEIIDDIKQEYSVLNFETPNADDQGIVERVDSAPVVKLVNSLILEAYQQNASDIHIEPQEHLTRVRFRVDGDLQEHTDFSNDFHSLLTTRIKIISGMNIAEKRIPQDGSFTVNNDFIHVDMRVSSLPTPFGEKIVMRLLGANRYIDYNLPALGLSPETMEAVEKALLIPHGILLVTGPTGSGKTTTLYAMLARLSKPKVNLVTVEDPIERRFDGITQVQVNPRAGLTFASGLRSILRQDPDVIMVGEIRDSETAEIAIRAAITGHYVLSTIHTNDALSTITRLVDMGVEPYLVASSVKCIISQRLIKKICTHCKEEVEISASDNRLLQTHLKTAKVGKGCQHCNQTGYQGRTAVHEVLMIEQGMEELISRRASMEELRKYTHERGMRMLRDEVLELIDKGVTTVDEGIRILYAVE
ncbi:MAG: ATPase, T2SS/T4P/T4SS family [Erysipelotrichaceae bacterium]